jgi:hypothetical protein
MNPNIYVSLEKSCIIKYFIQEIFYERNIINYYENIIIHSLINLTVIY